MGQGRVGSGNPLDQDLQLATGFLLPPQAGGDNPGVVKHQQIVRAQEVQQFGKAVMADLSSDAMQIQQATGTALRQRVLGDQLGGENVGEVGAFHR